jgi:hypothetical protein
MQTRWISLDGMGWEGLCPSYDYGVHDMRAISLVCGPEYQFVDKVWLRADAGVPFDLVRAYRTEVVQKDRLATLRPRKRPREEVSPVEETGRSARKNVKHV